MAHQQLLLPGVASATGGQNPNGVVPSQGIRKLIENGTLLPGKESGRGIEEDQIQPASVDLRLGEIAYRVQASFLPGENSTVENRISDLKMAELDLTKPAVLECGCVYIIPLIEELFLSERLSAKANPKSTTGRLDIFARLITDYGTKFEWVAAGYKGKLYAEVVPNSFSVMLQTSMKLNQLRFVQGKPSSFQSRLEALDEEHTLVYSPEDSPQVARIDKGLWISVSTRSENSQEIIAYRAKRNTPVIDLSRVNHYDPEVFWDCMYPSKSGRLVLDPGDFYILGSRDKYRVPPGSAAEMVPLETSIGEFRIHYAGFFDPGFGYGLNDIKGTKAVLEVRAHEVPFVIEDGQIVGRLNYMDLLEPPDKVYGAKIGSSYQGQALALSRQFKSPARPGR